MDFVNLWGGSVVISYQFPENTSHPQQGVAAMAAAAAMAEWVSPPTGLLVFSF
ncbi:MAG: hypothetical protein K8L97_18410 [Anaerolineae bacterium]|nr:hypothetical protein [Anaerolineae bacterium]